MAHNPLPGQLAAQAELAVNTLTQTDYQHIKRIDVVAGIYDCDCNAFVGFVLEGLAPAHYAMVPRESTQPRPRAFEYYEFFASRTGTTDGWHRINLLADARRGDILAWRFPKVEVGFDTGHVVFLAETPVVGEGGVVSVRVYDSANQPHFDDTRGPDTFPNGVGSGILKFQVDAEGRPTAFQFAPGDQFVAHPIAIGRAEPLS